MRLLRQDITRYVSSFYALFFAAMLAGCFTDSQTNKVPPPHDPTQDKLQAGDRIKVQLLGTLEEVKIDDQEINAEGNIVLTYLNIVGAAGKSPSQLSQELTEKYRKGYFPNVTVTVTPVARFFFVGGQVNNNAGGRILYAGPIRVLGAIQAAGDFTPFADKRHVQITRVDGTIFKVNCVDAIKHPEKDLWIYPGDRIYVGRRF
jgi:protein involved in polysaccharide export with SLBB domain